MCIWAPNYSTDMNTSKSHTKQQLILRIPLYSREESVLSHFYVTHNVFKEKKLSEYCNQTLQIREETPHTNKTQKYVVTPYIIPKFLPNIFKDMQPILDILHSLSHRKVCFKLEYKSNIITQPPNLTVMHALTFAAYQWFYLQA
jgi:hypothetical protein